MSAFDDLIKLKYQDFYPNAKKKMKSQLKQQNETFDLDNRFKDI